jgi:hypothetical protein
MGCKTDGEKNLSNLERVLVEYCFEEYKKNGTDHVFKIPNHIDRQLVGHYFPSLFQQDVGKTIVDRETAAPTAVARNNIPLVCIADRINSQGIELESLRMRQQQRFEARQETPTNNDNCCCRTM